MESIKQSLSDESFEDDDQTIKTLVNWVRHHGGIVNVEIRRDRVTGVRGLYAAEQITDEDTPIVQIPNKLIVSPLHIQQQQFTEQKKYKDVFELCEVTFDEKYPFEPNDKVPTKMENVFAEYFQLTFFLIFERLKQDNSFWKPFLDYLPKENQTLFTLDESQTIGQDSQVRLLSEIQRQSDDIYAKIQYDAKLNEECKQRFQQFLSKHLSAINEMQGSDYTVEQVMQLWDWAWMNLSTRCFGHHHLPNDIAMCPLLDLVNHAQEQTKLRFFLCPWQVNKVMLEIEIDRMTNAEMILDLYYDSLGMKQETEEGTLCQDRNQHADEYPDRYFNYRPVEIIQKGGYPPKGEDTSAPDFWKDNTIQHQKFSDVWDLNNQNIAFGLKLHKNYKLSKHEQIFICYGERANSFLLVEYGFAIPNNCYDFFRVNNVTISDFEKSQRPFFQQNLDALNLKDTLRADLKIMGLHRDVLKLIRANQEVTDSVLKTEITVLQLYYNWLNTLESDFQTSLQFDEQLYEKVRFSSKYFWMYQFVLLYRIGQKQIIQEHKFLCQQVKKALMGAPEDIISELTTINSVSNSMKDYFKIDLGLNFN